MRLLPASGDLEAMRDQLRGDVGFRHRLRFLG